MAAIELTRFDAAQHITEPEDQAEVLADAIASGDAHIIAKAIGLVARAHGMTELAKETGIARQQLYRALGSEGNPTLDTLIKVVAALNLQLSITPPSQRNVEYDDSVITVDFDHWKIAA